MTRQPQILTPQHLGPFPAHPVGARVRFLTCRSTVEFSVAGRPGTVLSVEYNPRNGRFYHRVAVDGRDPNTTNWNANLLEAM